MIHCIYLNDDSISYLKLRDQMWHQAFGDRVMMHLRMVSVLLYQNYQLVSNDVSGIDDRYRI
jgi:hypothetical protein